MVSPAPAPFRQATELDRAVVLHRAGRFDEALAVYEGVLAGTPNNADALNLSGLVYLTKGDGTAAVERITQAVKLDPTSALFRLNLGSALLQSGQHERAVGAFERALKFKPDLAEAWAGLGMARAARGEERKAAHALRRAVAFNPQLPDAWNNLALVLGRLGEYDEARRAADQAIAVRPAYAVAHNTAGVLAREDCDMAASLAHLQKAVELAPGYFEAQSNLGISLTDLRRYDEAVAAFDAALSLRADHAETWRAAAKPLAALGEISKARAACDRALAFAPEDRRIVWERALIDLAAGDFAAGWDGYRARSIVDRRRYPMPRAKLDGDLHGQLIMLDGEQGLGEELFFLRFGAPLQERGASIIACVDERLVDIVSRIPFVGEACARSAVRPSAKIVVLRFPLGDLPWLSGTDVLPPAPIAARDELRERIRARLAAVGPAPYVGLTWRAGIAGRATLYKEAPVDLIAEAVAGTQGTLVALQRNPFENEIAELSQRMGRPLADFTDLNDDLEVMLALMHEIDAYVAVSNTNVHLAAAARAAGAKVCAHVLVPCPAEFRWLAAGETSPWFPGFPVYREDPRLGWTPAGESLRHALSGI
jgi:tetratricopeptide (TPR) repeat protein